MPHPSRPHRDERGVSLATATAVLLVLGTLLCLATSIFLLNTKAPTQNTDLATLLQQNPGDYALSFGHFLDLNAQALGLFRLPLALTALALFFGRLPTSSSAGEQSPTPPP